MAGMRRAALLGMLLLAGGSLPARSMTSCTPGPYIVFFEHDDGHLGREARATLDESVEALGNCGFGKTYLAGHSDTSEPARVSNDRVAVVRDYLAARGTPRSYIRGRAYGSTQPRIRTARGVQERLNRRVEITFGPPD